MSLTTTPSRLSKPAQLFRDALKLSKYRLSALVALTASTGYILRYEPPTPTPTPNPNSNPPQTPSTFLRQLTAVTTGTWLSAACANTLNQMYEVHSDARMSRTRARPLPAGRLGLAQAALFSVVTGVTGVSILLQETNAVAAEIAAANIALYAALYTPLKRVSTVNTWVGAVVGALPPMLGWAAASDGRLGGERERGAWALGGLLFLWQIPHFHALAVVSRADYRKGGLRMLAVSDPVRNAWWARVVSGGMVPLGWAFVESGVTSGVFGLEMAALGGWLWRGSGRMVAEPTSVTAARGLFKASIFHLPLTLGLLMAHRVEYCERRERGEAASVARVSHPWEMMLPFPFLPVPLSAPMLMVEGDER